MKHFYKEIIPAYPNEKLWFTYEKIYNMVVENAKDGDKLKFEIIDVYKGTKFKDTGLSEFVFQSTGN